MIGYYFEEIKKCNMCDSSILNHKTLGKRLNKSQGMFPKEKIGVTTTICRCTVCGLVFSNPQPIPINIQDHYGVPPEDYWGTEYFEISPNYFQGEIKILNNLIDIQSGLKSLDIGAGIGKQMKVLEKEGFDVYGIEPSKSFYDRAISKMGISSEKLKMEMIEETDYPKEYFDFISFGVVLEHLYDPSSAIQKALKWVKPQGLIHIEVPSSDWLVNKLINLFYKINLNDYVGNISPMHEPYHLYEFSLKSFEKNAAKYNYKIVHHEYYVSKTFLPKILDRFIKPYMKRTNTGMQLSIWIQKDTPKNKLQGK